MSDNPQPNNHQPEPQLTHKPGRSLTPYNPALQSLVEGKQKWAHPLDEVAKAQGFRGWHQRGYLPHHDFPGAMQLLTFRLVDSLPANCRGEWEHLLRIEDNPERRRKIEEYLDRGRGECWLRRPPIMRLAEQALRHFDRKRYRIEAWAVMPNHMHVVVEIWQIPMSEIIKSWKSFIAVRANKLLRRSGAFWQREYLDTVIRDEEHHRCAVNYVEGNPVKAGLCRKREGWPGSSARFRDEYRSLGKVENITAS
jgi:REP element-mobilizing transposase RayT